MTCAEFESFILDQIDGRLSPDMLALVQNHLAVCHNCRAFLDASTEVDRSMTHLASRSALSPGFTADVLAKLARHPRFVSLEAIGDFAGLAGLAASGAFCVWHLLPHLSAAGGWVAATVILCGGAYFVAADREIPH
jgi:hypothetical protein